jgi:predicted RNA binding protein YcfA (HicA-like mRNA interferase family)
MPPILRDCRDIIRRLKAEGWYIHRKGPGDHIQFKHPTKPGKVTVDGLSRKDLPEGTVRSIYRQAGWPWK